MGKDRYRRRAPAGGELTAGQTADQRRILYGRRVGRPLRPGQKALIETVLPSIEVALPAGDAALDPASLFGAAITEVWLEIGFGAGEHLAWQAAANPDAGFIGCEPFLNGVARLLGHLQERRLDNVRVLKDDARLLLGRLEPGSIGRVYILFPDPWPKARHARRRMIGPETLDQLARVLRPGAELRFASDDPVCLSWSLAHLVRHPAFEWQARGPRDWRGRPPDWPATRYEAKALAAGRRPAYLRFVRRVDTP